MKLDKLNQWLTLAANIGVIAGIVFLAYQIKQNTSAIQADSYQGLIETSAGFWENLAVNTDVLGLIVKARTDRNALSQEEALRLVALGDAQWIRFQGAYQHWQRGSLSTGDWQSYANAICSSNGLINVAQEMSWHGVRDQLLEDFVEYVEACRSDLAETAN